MCPQRVDLIHVVQFPEKCQESAAWKIDTWIPYSFSIVFRPPMICLVVDLPSIEEDPSISIESSDWYRFEKQRH